MNITKEYNVLLDKNHPLYEKFQVKHSIPSKFLINKKGTIIWQYINKKADGPPIEKILNVIEEKI